MHILVTGATGHLGANLVREALADGHTVRALARSTSSRAALQGLDVEVVVGDILEPATLQPACADVELVLHAAAVYRNWAADDAEIVRPSVEGTENVLRAAAAAGVHRVVHTSSNATVGFPRDGVAWNESHHMVDPQSPYVRAKCASEARALALGAELELEVVVVNPCGILGPHDHGITPSTQAVIDMARGGPAVLDLAITHVADVARGHLLAAERGTPGERYLLSGDNLTKAQVAELMSESTGRRVRAMSPPRLVLRLLAWNEVRKARAGSGDAGLTPEILADAFGSRLHYDSRKAKAQLGWTPRPAADVLRDTLAWLAAQGRLPDDVAAHVRAQPWGRAAAA